MHVQDDGNTALREGLRDSDDPRAVRTRVAVFDAARALNTANQPISVSAITRAAGVSRSVFYTHFEDLGELATRMLEPQFAAIDARAIIERDDDPHEAMLAAQRRLVRHFAEHRAIYLTALQLTGHAIADHIERAMRGPIERHIERIGGAPDRLDGVVAARYIAAGATHVIEAWLAEELDDDIDEERVAMHLYRLLPPWMHADVKPRSEP